jgi:hypothetical protein
MSRTTPCLIVAATLCLGSVGVAAGRALPALDHLSQALSADSLSPDDQRLVRFLLMLPVAALIVCLARVVVGLTTFGTFSPALLGLAFRESTGPAGVFVFLAVLSAGWLLRRLVGRLHLLQIPRTAVVLSGVVGLLVGAAFLAPHTGIEPNRLVSLLPLVIVTGVIERFVALEDEDGTPASLRTLFATVAVAGCVSLVLAGQLLLGRYTGYRLSELARFRDFRSPPLAPTLERGVRFRRPAPSRG